MDQYQLNGVERMVVDEEPVSPATAATYNQINKKNHSNSFNSISIKEKDLFEQQPTAPRRNSIEDQDASRPRKRLATMGSASSPQGNSPTLMDEEIDTPSLEHRQRKTPPPSTLIGPTSSATVSESNTPTPSSSDRAPTPATTSTAMMDQTSDSPSPQLQAPADDYIQSQTSQGSSNQATVNVRPTRPPSAQSDVPEHSVDPTEVLDEPEKLVDTISSEASGTQSPWNDEDDDEEFPRSPEVEVEEIDNMEEDDPVTVIEPDRGHQRIGIIDQLTEFGRMFGSSEYQS